MFLITVIATILFFHLDGRLPPDIVLYSAYLDYDIYCFGFIIQFASAAIAVRDRFEVLRESFLDKKILNEKINITSQNDLNHQT